MYIIEYDCPANEAISYSNRLHTKGSALRNRNIFVRAGGLLVGVGLALLIGGALIGCPSTTGSGGATVCDVSVGSIDCDADGIQNGADQFAEFACATTDADGDGVPDTILSPDVAGDACDTAGATALVAALRADTAVMPLIPDCVDATTLHLCTDVDDDNDGLIEINFLEDLDFVRHNLAGTSYDIDEADGAGALGSTGGAPTTEQPACDDGDANTTRLLCGYELVRSLDFAVAADYAAGELNMDWRPNNADPSMATNSGWLPLAHDTEIDDAADILFQGDQFSAILEGNGNSIAKLYINRGDENFVGLIGAIGRDGVVRNLGLADVFVLGKYVVGGLASSNRGTISSSYSTGSITGVGVAGSFLGAAGFVGGLIGVVDGGTIAASYSSGTVTGMADNVGGLVGRNGSSIIIASYSSSNVMGANVVGGLVGSNSGGTISASYSSGTVTGDTIIGGLIGVVDGGTIAASYSSGRVMGTTTIGGLIGSIITSGTITANYWDSATSMQTNGVGSGTTGLSTAQMQSTESTDVFGGTTAAMKFGGCGVAYLFNATAEQHYPRLRRFLGTSDDMIPAADCSNHSYHASELLDGQGQ